MSQAVPIRALMVEAREDHALWMANLLQREGLTLDWKRVDGAESLRQAFREQAWDLILSEYSLPGFTALEALRICQDHGVDVPFLIVSEDIGEDIAVEAMRLGARDFLPWNRLARLPATIERELREAENRRKGRAAEAEQDRQARELALRNKELTQRSEQLCRSNHDLERFAFLAAHGLREPLRTINSYTQLLVGRYGATDGESEEFSTFIENGVSRMSAIIDGLLAYFRLAHGTDLQAKAVESQQAVDEAMRANQEGFQETGASIEIGPMPLVFADLSYLTHVFEHLISNAIKYRKPQGRPRIAIGSDGCEGFQRFWVRDNGIGIHPLYYDQIFLLFTRLHNEDDYPGTGIGLALARRLLEDMGGQIWVDSVPGEGSTFYFTLPGAGETARASAA